MRKLKILLALLMLLSMLSPSLAIAQTQTPQVPVSVDGKGVMRDQSGQEIDRRLFAFTTYDADGKQRLRKGTARKRPNTMYLHSSLITNNNLNDKNSAQWKEYRAYMAAERRYRRNKRTTGYQRVYRSAPQTIVRQTTVTTPPTAEQLANIQTSLRDNESFRQQLAALLAKDTTFIKLVAANLPATPAPAGTPVAVVVTDSATPGFFTTTWQYLVDAFYWLLSWWIVAVIIGLIILLLILLFNQRFDYASKGRDRYSMWQTKRTERRAASKAAANFLPDTPPTSYKHTSSQTIHSEFQDDSATIGTPDIPKGEWKTDDELTRVEPRKPADAKTHFEMTKTTTETETETVEQS